MDFYEKPSAENGLSCTWTRTVCFNKSKFEAAYPGAGGRIILLSKIGYNSDRTQALLATLQSDERDSGMIHILLLTQQAGQWKIEDQYEDSWIT